MRTQRLGCLTPTGLIAALVTVLILAVTGIVRGGALFSPGELNAATGQALGSVTSHAELSTQCSTCHTAPWETPSMADRCVDCHTAIQADLTNPKTLHGALAQRSGSNNCIKCHTEHNGPQATLTRMDISGFPHEVTGFSLKGHARLADGSPFTCKACHEQGYASPVTLVCAGCHSRTDSVYMENHAAAFGQDCLGCHDGVDTYGKAFNHNKVSFSLAGKHTQVECAGCHQKQTSITVLRGTPATCTSCHLKDDAHKGIMGTGCTSCHTPTAWKPSSFDHHTLTNFPLVGKHAQATCTGCHTNPDLKSTPKDCTTCHGKEDPHQGKLGASCAACHTADGWKPSTFDHTRSAFLLTGSHQQTACTACHKDMLFKGTPANCSACHAKDDSHRGQLGDCAACHSTTAWKPSTFNHSRASFQLTGAHVSTACTACHTNQSYKGVPTNCAGCHQKDDTHKGNLGANCAGCHTTTAWKPSTFNHNNAAFQLTGAHASVACATCHANQVFKGIPSNCAGCHQKDDTHKGSLGAGCAGCHSTSAWKPSTFNHNNAAFKLTGAHVSVNCTACHTNQVFKGTPATCFACHAKDDHHSGQFGTDCAACHATDRWGNVTFDHSKSQFPLTGAHNGLPCQRCHSSGFRGTPTACSSCHKEPAIHAGLFMANCNACHSTAAWLPAGYNGPHTFPRNHGGANSCRDCHTSSLNAYTCYTCHNQSEIVNKHREQNVSNLNNCIACHPAGNKEGGGGD